MGYERKELKTLYLTLILNTRAIRQGIKAGREDSKDINMCIA